MNPEQAALPVGFSRFAMTHQGAPPKIVMRR